MLTRTTTALLDDLADPANEAIWETFDARYRPVLVGFARQLGFAGEDAADLAQEALVRFVRSYRDGKYQRGRGRLSSWIIGIARNCAIEQYRTRAARPAHRGMSAVEAVPDDGELESVWRAECDRAVLRQAVDSLREDTHFEERTVRIFERVVLDEVPAADVARQLDVTANDVYLAKHRCLKRLRTVIETLTAAYERDE
ncbi:MAG: sigma-70 family RNA polymerase sigma factor [Planctomycetes bacterium]|nr:sigma-70 family RNA polymerase sigma factor [Planctomycetota bacterium]